MGGKSGSDDLDVDKLVKQQAEANRINQYTPQGSLIYGQTNAQGQFSPQKGAASMAQETPYQAAMRGGLEQGSVALANQVLPQAYNQLPGISTAGLPERPTDYGADRQRIEQSVYDRGYSLIQPDLDMQQRRLDQNLANQGLPMGSEAYAGEQDRFQRGRGETLTRLAQGATEAGGAEQSRLQGMVEGGRQAGLGEQQLMRSGPLQELAMIMGGQYNPTPAGQFYGPSPINTLDPALAQAKLSQQRSSDILGGLFTLGGAGIGAAYGGPAGAGAGGAAGNQIYNSGYWGR